ncbi:hypothetical protein ACP179_01535 (plasmid) [Xenorhabdus stockiae]|uniref:hypothetical protein n=1 Tax=Xenorhabdus stockiae TaxID=351614 RepID=UPI003CEE5C2A
MFSSNCPRTFVVDASGRVMYAVGWMSKHDDGFIAYCYVSQLRPTFGFGGTGLYGIF